jgi:hypothetical protein
MTNSDENPALRIAPQRAPRLSDLRAFSRARKEALNLVQWLARIANSFVAAGTREQHLLHFSAANAAFSTHSFDHTIALELRLPSLELQFLENGRRTPHVFDPEEHSPAEVEAWLLVELLHRNLDGSKFTKALPYTIPDLLVGDADKYSPRSCTQGLAELAAWFRVATAALQAAATICGTEAYVVCRPETLTLTCSSERKPGEFGFVPGDEEDPEPYFFVDAPNNPKRSILAAARIANQSEAVALAAEFLVHGDAQ